MITGLLILWPLLASIFVFASRSENIKKVAFSLSAVEFVISLVAFFLFKSGNTNNLNLEFPWVPQFGLNFHIAIDGINLILLLLTNLLTPLIILSSLQKNYDKPSTFYGLTLLMQMALVGVFLAKDGLLFYIFWELALIPIYFICAFWGGNNRIAVTWKFFIYTLFGSLLMLAAIVYLYTQTPAPHSFDFKTLYSLALSPEQQKWIFWAFFIAFAIKIPVFPLHTWQPDTYTQSTTPGTMLLSGIMLKMGLYGLILWIPVFPDALKSNAWIVITLSVAGIIYASCIALIQKDFKRLIAYVSIAHVNLIAAGILTQTHQGMQGAVFQMLSHGINAVGLFLVVDIISRRTKTHLISELGGIANENKLFTVLFLILLLGGIALPLTNGFVGEFLLLMGVYQFGPWYGAFAGLTIILGAYYMLKSYQRIMLGETKALTAKFESLSGSETFVLVTLAALTILLGVYPKVILDITEPAVKEVLSYTIK